jgi:hypothetical protein
MFQGFIDKELAVVQKVLEQKNKIEYEKQLFKKHLAKFSVKEIQGYKFGLLRKLCKHIMRV